MAALRSACRPHLPWRRRSPASPVTHWRLASRAGWDSSRVATGRAVRRAPARGQKVAAAPPGLRCARADRAGAPPLSYATQLRVRAYVKSGMAGCLGRARAGGGGTVGARQCGQPQEAGRWPRAPAMLFWSARRASATGVPLDVSRRATTQGYVAARGDGSVVAARAVHPGWRGGGEGG